MHVFSCLRTFNEVSENGILIFAPWASKIAPELSGYSKVEKKVEEMLNFFRKTVREHKKTLPEDLPRLISAFTLYLPFP